jgi:antitoxin component of MazEF toxin-antitoxin module
MAQKIITVGSSIGVVFPKPMAEEFGFSAGQAVEVRAEGPNRVVVERIREGKGADITDTVKWAVSYIEKYRKDFESLADK